MRFTSSTFRSLGLGAVIAIVIAACAGAVTGAGGSSATIALANPTDGQAVSVPFDVRIDASVPLGAPETGNHHAHLYFDTTTDAGDYDIVYGTTATVSRPLGPGQHTIIVALANPDHSLAGPTQQISVNVGADGGSGAPAAPASPAPSNPPIQY